MPERLALYESPTQELPGLEDFEIQRGINSALTNLLIEKSREPQIAADTPNDSQVRFRDMESLDRWLNEDRQIYPLVNTKIGDLSGVLWHGPKPFPVEDLYTRIEAPQHTMGIRLYDGYRGRGLALPFMQYCLADYVATMATGGQADEFHGIWLSTEPARTKAFPLFKRFGYDEVARTDNQIIMVLLPSKIREILGA